MDVINTNTDWVSTLWLSFIPFPGDSKPFSQRQMTQKRGYQDMSHWPHCLRTPRSPWVDSATPNQAQPCFASATTRWYGQQPWESSSFSKVCLLYKHNRKMKAKCPRWRGWSKSGERQRSWRWPAAPSPARRSVWRRRGPASHHAVRPHRPYFL